MVREAKERFGKAAKNMDKKWGHVVEQAGVVAEVVASQRIDNESKIRAAQEASGNKSLPSDTSARQNPSQQPPPSSSSTESKGSDNALRGAEDKDPNSVASDSSASHLNNTNGDGSATSCETNTTIESDANDTALRDDDEDFSVDIDEVRDDTAGEFGRDSDITSADKNGNMEDLDLDYDSDDEMEGVRRMKRGVENATQLLATGEMATKFEVVVNFLQIYGLVLNFDLTIEWLVV